MNAPLDRSQLEQEITLEDKWTLEKGRAFMTGTQALIRLPMMQRDRDLKAGLNTAGYITGYRGSPVTSVDMTAVKANKHLEAHHVHFHPGLNEDLAATAVWGTQQTNLFKDAKYDGVFSMWYGKGPGVDRCGDVFKHGNNAGSSKFGGVVILAGDDHAAKSSSTAHQSDHILTACGIPVLYPSSVQEYIDYGLHAWAMSRYTGLWVSMKCVTDIIESGAVVDFDPDRVQINVPTEFVMPEGGLNIRWPDAILDQEVRMNNYKWYAALAYARANKLNRIIWDSPNPKIGIITAGKSYLDTRQALADLGIDEQAAADIGIRLYKIGMTWPLEADGVHDFAKGLDEILVVEEKRQVLEYALKEELYNLPDGQRPRVVGKFDDSGEWSKHGNHAHTGHGDWLLPATYELNPAQIARAIASRISHYCAGHPVEQRVKERIAFLEAKELVLKAVPAKANPETDRTPYFCSGCPHNSSTKVPEGSRALAGIGCHYMVLWMDRETSTFTHMGAEGVTWVGQAPFTTEKHVFTNLGDGTYFHSGILAIRAAVSAKVNITYKILFNDAVAMTGGQEFDGPLDPGMISRQIAAEGVHPIIVVTDEPEKYPDDYAWAPGVTVRHRSELMDVQRELRDMPGVSAMIYDQTCASEKRRRRKKGEYPDPAKRAVINEAVCEGCGDCFVLDDGFQHRRLHRDADVVLIDATNPFGYGHVLPRGMLREPIEGLRRANLIVITRATLATASAIETIERTIRAIHPVVPIVRADARLDAPVDADGRQQTLDGRRVLAFSGIGNPAAFERSLADAGVNVVACRRFGDHHRYAARRSRRPPRRHASRRRGRFDHHGKGLGEGPSPRSERNGRGPLASRPTRRVDRRRRRCGVENDCGLCGSGHGAGPKSPTRRRPLDRMIGRIFRNKTKNFARRIKKAARRRVVSVRPGGGGSVSLSSTLKVSACRPIWSRS